MVVTDYVVQMLLQYCLNYICGECDIVTISSLESDIVLISSMGVLLLQLVR